MGWVVQAPHASLKNHSPLEGESGRPGRSPQSSRRGANTAPRESKNKGTLLNYWNNSIPTSTPWLAGNDQPTLRRTRLNGPASQHALSHSAVSTLAVHFQSISESPCPVIPLIQQRPRFFPGRLALSPQLRGNPCGCPVVRGGQETEAGPSGKDSWRQERALCGILLYDGINWCSSALPLPGVAALFSLFRLNRIRASGERNHPIRKGRKLMPTLVQA